MVCINEIIKKPFSPHSLFDVLKIIQKNQFYIVGIKNIFNITIISDILESRRNCTESTKNYLP